MSEIIVSGSITSVTTVDASNTYLVESGGELDILSGGVVSGLITVGSGGRLDVFSGGTELGGFISSGGMVYDDGAVSGTTIGDGGVQQVENFGTAIGTTVASGGRQDITNGGTAVGTTIDSGGTQRVLQSGTVIGTTINSGGFLQVGVQFIFYGGGSATAIGTTISRVAPKMT